MVMRKDIVTHFAKADPAMYSLIQKVSLDPLVPSNDFFRSLCREIIGQQLAGNAAHAIFTRFIKLFPKGRITAKKLLTLPDDAIRSAGLSWAKVRSLKDLANNVVKKHIQLQSLVTLSNEDVIKELVKVKGIGPWTAEMFLMFSLAREDVFSLGDLGLQNAIQKLYNLKRKPTQKQLISLSRKWSPYRTYACLLLWESIDANIT